MVQLFSVPAFFILFRETLEASIILSVMMALLDKIVEDRAQRRRMKKQVWIGVVGGVTLALIAATIFLSLYYTVAKDAWDSSEGLWEGILGLIAVVLITLMAFSMIRVETWKAKWEKKLTKVTEDALVRQNQPLQSKRSKYAMIMLPGSVVLREGVEAVIFLGGIGLHDSGTSLPIPAVVGASCGILVGYLLYRGASTFAFKYFLLFSTAFLLLIAAGLFTGSVHEFEEYRNTEHFLWHMHCCHEDKDGFWKLLNAVIGWRDEGTIATVTSYIVYWVFVFVALILLRIKWNREAEREATQQKLDELNKDGPAATAV